MRIKKIQNHFDNEELEKVLESCSEEFNKIERWAGLLKEGLLKHNPSEAQTALSELTGYYMRLNPILHLSEYYANKIETLTRNNFRTECIKEGNKYTTPMDSQAKIKARAEAIDYNRIANIVKSYVEDCKQAIGSIQSLLKDMREESKLSGRTENTEE